MRIFLASVLNFVLFHCFGFVKKNFLFGPLFSILYMTPLYLLKIVFPKLDPLTVTGIALFVDLGPKCQFKLNSIPLSLRLSGIEFSLVSD